MWQRKSSQFSKSAIFLLNDYLLFEKLVNWQQLFTRFHSFKVRKRIMTKLSGLALNIFLILVNLELGLMQQLVQLLIFFDWLNLRMASLRPLQLLWMLIQIIVRTKINLDQTKIILIIAIAKNSILSGSFHIWCEISNFCKVAYWKPAVLSLNVEICSNLPQNPPENRWERRNSILNCGIYLFFRT